MESKRNDPQKGQQTTNNYSLFSLKSDGNSSIPKGGAIFAGGALGAIVSGATIYSKMQKDQQVQFQNGFLKLLGGTLGGMVFGGLSSSFIYYLNSLSDAKKDERGKKAEAAKRIAIIKAEAEAYESNRKADLSVYVGKLQAKAEFGISGEQGTPTSIVAEESLNDFYHDAERDWLENFHATYPRPKELPPIMHQIIRGCPEGFEEPMILHLLQAFGAICFPRVRAKFENTKNAPTLFVVIEGYQGQGKGLINKAHKELFLRVMEQDMKKLELLDSAREEGGDARLIIQTAGIGISKAKLIEILASNQGVHFDMFEPEISEVTRTLRNSNGGLEFEDLRKAFDNDYVYKNNKARNGRNGMFQLCFSFTFTGTPSSVDCFINKKELEGGTASRICWSAIPRAGQNIPQLSLPSEKDMEAIRDQIETWRQAFCYTTQDGADIACRETDIDLGYVEEALVQWRSDQFEIAKEENNRTRDEVRGRIGVIAFRCGMVLHMLYGMPTSRQQEVRTKVVALVLYLANYCMERYLYKFGACSTSMEGVPIRKEAPAPESQQPIVEEEKIQKIPISVVEMIAEENIPGVNGHGSYALAKKYGIFNGKGQPDVTRVNRALDELRNRATGTTKL